MLAECPICGVAGGNLACDECRGLVKIGPRPGEDKVKWYDEHPVDPEIVRALSAAIEELDRAKAGPLLWEGDQA